MRFGAVVAVALVVVACGSSSSGSGGGTAANGSPCYSGSACASSFCVLTGPDPAGTCQDKPAGCTKCSDDACDTALGAACSSGQGCSSSFGVMEVHCHAAATRKEGETCSVAVGCGAGLYCSVDASGPGTCKALPASCATDPTCECLKGAACGGTSHACTIIGSVALVECR